MEELHTRGPSTWLTLTYADPHLPIREGKPSLEPEHWRIFYDRLRQSTGLGKVRFFMVGEYGDKYARPHMHAVLFGVDPYRWRERLERCWTIDPKAREPEGYGSIQTDLVTPGRIAYIADYSLKRLTGDRAREVLAGRYPEFARMTRRPPLGYSGMRKILATMQKREGAIALAKEGDVPSRYHLEGHSFPFTQYWRDWLRVELGVEKPSFSEWELEVYESQKDREKAARRADKVWNRHQRKKAMKEL